MGTSHCECFFLLFTNANSNCVLKCDVLFFLAISVIMMGLDNAGKSTALYKMRTGNYCETVPTIGFNCEKIKGKINKSKDVVFTIWDVGGQERVRPLWRTYAKGADGIMFVVDSSADRESLEEAKLELAQLCKNSDTNTLPIVILANKQDLPNALSINHLYDYLTDELMLKNDFKKLTSPNKTSRPIKIIGVCAITGDGLFESLDLIHEMISANKKQKASSSQKRTK